MEENLCSLNSSAANNEGVVDLKASYDTGRQRKGSGGAITADQGMIFSQGQKVRRSWFMEHESVTVMNKVTGRVKEHDCRINWGGRKWKANGN